MELKLYSREWCSWCIDAKDYLTEKGYRFQEIDVGRDRQAYELMKQLSAQTTVPTLVPGAKALANSTTNHPGKFPNVTRIIPNYLNPFRRLLLLRVGLVYRRPRTFSNF